MNISPGLYSLFLLSDDATWIQPTFRVGAGWTDRELGLAALAYYGGDYFLAVEMCPDEACPERNKVADLGDFKGGAS